MVYQVKRNIIKGYRRGRLLKHPTINVRYYPYDSKHISYGIWASIVFYNKIALRSVTFVGNAITFKKNTKSIETHILDDFTKPVNNKLEIRFIKKIRPVKKFTSLDELIKQISNDCIIAKKLLKDYV